MSSGNPVTGILRRIGIPFFVLSLLACNLPFAIPGFASPNPGEPAESTRDMPLPVFNCPPKEITATLKFNHRFTTSNENMTLVLTVQGETLVNLIESIVTYAPGDRVGIHNVCNEPIPVQLAVEGMPECTGASGGTNMRADVTGTCTNGKLTLRIQEFYEYGELKLICGKDKIPAPVIFVWGELETPFTWVVPLESLPSEGLETRVPAQITKGNGERVYTLIVP